LTLCRSRSYLTTYDLQRKGDVVKALVQRVYGSPETLTWEDVPDPVPGEGEVLVRVHATSVNPYDWH